MRFLSKNPADTKRFARTIAKRLLASPHRNHATVVALSGDLGAGKTTFAQGFARALGIKQRIASPTFVIFRSYKLFTIHYSFFIHCDAYRLHNAKDLAALGFKKILTNPETIVLVEWPEHVQKLLPKDAVWVRMEHGRTESERRIVVR